MQSSETPKGYVQWIITFVLLLLVLVLVTALPRRAQSPMPSNEAPVSLEQDVTLQETMDAPISIPSSELQIETEIAL